MGLFLAAYLFPLTPFYYIIFFSPFITTQSHSFWYDTRSHHGIFKPNPEYTSQALFVTFSPIPKNPIHALPDPNWKHAIQQEFDALIENHT